MLGQRRDTVVLAPRAAGRESPDGARVLPVLRFSGRTGGPFKAYSVLQQLEVMLAPVVWCLLNRAHRPALFVCVQPLAAGVGGWLTWRLFRIPYLVLVHGEELTLLLEDRTPFRLRLRLQRLALGRAAAVVCNTGNTRRAAAELYGVPEARLRVVYPAIDTQEGEREPVEAAVAVRERLVGRNSRVILTVGRLAERHKGFDTAILAMASIARSIPDVKLVVVGPGDQSTLRATAESAGVAEKVVFTGLLDRADLIRLFRTCDLFLLPGREVGTTAEGFGIVYLEAARFAKPVVAGRAGGVPEAVVDGTTGVLVDGRSAPEVAAAVVSLLTDRPRAERLGREGRERVLRDFDGRRQHQQFSALVQELVGIRGRQGP
ncbi:MAG: glycosyltransferase family 4 protein [Gemmatimonadales bacterium]|nr:glycosyltransferase family 4 protein [Gemmatimonadales bacterium]MBA3553558.1 glycosyltransferase family 4 protein [Gemmatimonadales bacterium]